MIKIQNKLVGSRQPCFLIAEIAQAHNGSIAEAHKYIDLAAKAGADAVKFQTHIAKAESTLNEPFRTQLGVRDRSRYAYWRRMEFSFKQWSGLARHARQKGLIFLSSPFSDEAVDMLRKLGQPAWKIGSGEAVSGQLLDTILKKTEGVILLSTGMSSFAEIKKMVKKVTKARRKLVLLHCVSEYPTPLKNTGVNIMTILQRMLKVPCGLSDHSGTVFPAIGAIVLGANVVELHLVKDRSSRGFDASSSLTPEEFLQVRKFRDAWHTMSYRVEEKNQLIKRTQKMRKIFGRSLALIKPCPAGTIITSKLLTLKKPGTGIPLKNKKNLIGKILKHNVPENILLQKTDIK